MGLRSRFQLAAQAFRRTQPAESDFAATSIGGGAPPVRTTATVMEAYNTIPIFRACVDRMSFGTAMTKWELVARRRYPGATAYRYDDELKYAPPEERGRMLADLRRLGEIRTIDRHPALNCMRSGNPYFSGVSTMQLTQAYIDEVGEAFWLKEKATVAGRSMPIRVWPIPPTWVLGTPDDNDGRYRIRFGTLDYEPLPADMVRFHHPNPTNPYRRGSGLGATLGDEMNFYEMVAKFLGGHFNRRAIPPFIAAIPGIGKIGLQSAEQNFLQKMQGFFKGGAPWFTTHEVKISELSQKFDSMQLAELRTGCRDIFISTFGIPPELLGILENANRSTSTVADFIHSKWNLQPRLEFQRAVLQKQLIEDYDDRLILTYKSPVDDDNEFQLRVMQGAIEAFTVDEIRAKGGAAPDSSGNGGLRIMKGKSRFGVLEEGEEVDGEPEEDAPVAVSPDTAPMPTRKGKDK